VSRNILHYHTHQRHLTHLEFSLTHVEDRLIYVKFRLTYVEVRLIAVGTSILADYSNEAYHRPYALSRCSSAFVHSVSSLLTTLFRCSTALIHCPTALIHFSTALVHISLFKSSCSQLKSSCSTRLHVSHRFVRVRVYYSTVVKELHRTYSIHRT
jgi:hypothetical protein